MWRHAIFFQKLFQSIRPMKIKYAKDKGFYQSRSRSQRLVSNFLDTNLLLLCLGGFVGFKRFLTEEPDQSDRQAVKKYVLGGVLQLLFLGFHIAIMATIWTIRNRCSEIVWLVNQGHKLSMKREEASQNTPKKRLSFDMSRMFALLTWGIVGAVSLAVLTIGVTPFLFNATPAHNLLSFMVDVTKPNWKITLICWLYMMFVYPTSAAIDFSITMVYLCGALYETPFLLTKIAEYPQKPHPFQGEQQKHRAAYIYVQNFNQFGKCLFGSLMVTAFLINVSMTFCAIKYHSSLSPLLVGVFIVFDVIVLACTVALHTFAVIILEASADFREFWKKNVKGKLEQRQLRACRYLAVRIGIFFNLGRQVVVLTMDQIVNQTVNVLIMDS